MALRETSGSAGPPWERPLRGTLDRLVVESERLAGNPLGDPATRPLWVYRAPGAGDERGADRLRDHGLPRPGRHVGEPLPVRADDARADRRAVRERRVPAGDARVRRRVDELRRLAVPQLLEHRALPRLPVRRGRPVRRREVPDAAGPGAPRAERQVLGRLRRDGGADAAPRRVRRARLARRRRAVRVLLPAELPAARAQAARRLRRLARALLGGAAGRAGGSTWSASRTST